MAASLFTYSSTSRRVTPAPNSPPLPIHIKATNVVFNPDIPEVHRGLGLDDFVNFLTSCRLRYAISDVPSEFFPEQVCEFYYTATVNEENNAITGTIGHGRHSVFITAELLSAALRLPLFEPFSEPPTIERCKRMFDQLGYDHSKAGTRSALILRQCMTPGWKFFTGALCKCVGHKSRSGDQLSNYEQQVVCSLLLNKRLDYGALFFDQLVQLLRANVRADHVPFPRWIALVFDKFFAADYFSHSGNPIQCPRMSVRMYQDDPLDSDIGISDRMREWIAHPYTMPSLSADTDEGGADGDHVDHADQEVDRYDGGHSSLHLLLTLSLSLVLPPQLHRIPCLKGSNHLRGIISLRGSILLKGCLTLRGSIHPQQLATSLQGCNPAFQLLQHDSLNPVEEADPAGHDSPAATERLSDDSEHNDEHESDSAGHSSPAATEKLFEDSDDDEERDEPDDECQIFDMNFIDPLIPVQQESLDDLEESIPILADPIADSIIPVQGEDSDIASEESHRCLESGK
ncbi:unnamed protein product [Lactuca saligna]|uniref:Uncharacterized protein n=1 Tax=Lactuca saligna TaxID=75948 RepID=A0AA36A1H9_LACSI|nr:unnamed protein product [Lactuca saligna]